MTTAIVGEAVAPRFLDLPGLVNARDLGGWPRRGGGRTLFDPVWRSDGPVHADRGIVDALAERGVRTVLDRTGVVSALLLRASGVDAETVARAYALTHDRIEPLRPRLLAAGTAFGIPSERYEPLLRAEPSTMRATLGRFDEGLLRGAAGILGGD